MRSEAPECVDRTIEFSLAYQIDERVRDGVTLVPTGCWHPAVDADGQDRDGAEVVELTNLVNLDAWPAGTRLIVRRERPHPGAQLSLFDRTEGFRHTAFITNTNGYDIAAPSRVTNVSGQPGELQIDNSASKTEDNRQTGSSSSRKTR